MALLLALVAALSGVLLTYLYDEDAPLFARLGAGACVGFAALGLIGFIIASFIGLTLMSLALSALIVALPLAVLATRAWRERVLFDIRAGARELARGEWRTLWPLALLLVTGVMFWFVFDRAFFAQQGALLTGVENNLGDLPFHLAIIEGFVRGANFPPQHPEFAGARLTYPFIVDFIAAMFVRGGAALTGALFWENLMLALALTGLLYRFALKLTRVRAAAVISVALTLLSGGLGWWVFVREWLDGRSCFDLLAHLPHKYTITYDNVYRWGNAVTTLLVPQRALLLGLPLALVVITAWWQMINQAEVSEQEIEPDGAERKGKKAKKRKGDKIAGASSAPSLLSAFPFSVLPGAARDVVLRRMIGAGVVAGLLPLVHAHTFVVLMVVGACLALLFPRWRLWFAFFLTASVLALPQMWWATRASAVKAGSFFELTYGWDHGQQSLVWFWFKNTGLFIPALIAALAWRGRVLSNRLLLFYLPFTLCFIVANVTKLSPYLWDNIKVLFYWYVVSVPLVALLIVRLWRAGKEQGWPTFATMLTRVVTVALFIALTCAGALDVWRVASGAEEQREFDRDGIAFAELIAEQTPPRSLILIAPTYNHPVFLAGRRALLGYGGHLWSQGIKYEDRETEVKTIYAGGGGADALLAKYGVDYIVVGPLERAALPVNDAYFTRFTRVGETGEYQLYKVARP
jgi:hypothetical protein